MVFDNDISISAKGKVMSQLDRTSHSLPLTSKKHHRKSQCIMRDAILFRSLHVVEDNFSDDDCCTRNFTEKCRSTRHSKKKGSFDISRHSTVAIGSLDESIMINPVRIVRDNSFNQIHCRYSKVLSNSDTLNEVNDNEKLLQKIERNPTTSTNVISTSSQAVAGNTSKKEEIRPCLASKEKIPRRRMWLTAILCQSKRSLHSIEENDQDDKVSHCRETMICVEEGLKNKRQLPDKSGHHSNISISRNPSNQQGNLKTFLACNHQHSAVRSRPPSEIIINDVDEEGCPNRMMVKSNEIQINFQLRFRMMIQQSIGFDLKHQDAIEYDPLFPSNSVRHIQPSPVEIASFGANLFNIFETNDVSALQEYLLFGISCNPTSEYGDSFLHVLSRYGKPELLKMALGIRASVGCKKMINRTVIDHSHSS